MKTDPPLGCLAEESQISDNGLQKTLPHSSSVTWGWACEVGGPGPTSEGPTLRSEPRGAGASCGRSRGLICLSVQA